MNHRTLVPEAWTPEQAMLVFDFLTDITRTIWEQHQAGLVDLCIQDAAVRAHQEPEANAPQTAYDYDGTDEIPF